MRQGQPDQARRTTRRQEVLNHDADCCPGQTQPRGSSERSPDASPSRWSRSGPTRLARLSSVLVHEPRNLVGLHRPGTRAPSWSCCLRARWVERRASAPARRGAGAVGHRRNRGMRRRAVLPYPTATPAREPGTHSSVDLALSENERGRDRRPRSFCTTTAAGCHDVQTVYGAGRRPSRPASRAKMLRVATAAHTPSNSTKPHWWLSAAAAERPAPPRRLQTR